MKIPRTFPVAFAAACLLLLTHTWWPQLFGLAWAYSFILFYLGGFAALVLVVGADLARPRKITRQAIVVRGAILGIVGLLVTLSMFSYFRNAIVVLVSLASILVFAGLLLLLVGSVLWSCVQDYFDIFRRRPRPTGPQEWRVLEEEQLPVNAAAAGRAKERFAHSYAVEIVCRPRTSHYGLISQPLKMDE